MIADIETEARPALERFAALWDKPAAIIRVQLYPVDYDTLRKALGLPPPEKGYKSWFEVAGIIYERV